jgi:hypothetical protein
LAAGIKKLLRGVGIEAYMIFLRGSRLRIQALREQRCHIALMSTFAANALCSKQEDIGLMLPAGSYVGEYRILYRPEAEYEDHPLRVAVDSASYDTTLLTHLEFEGQDIITVDMNTLQIYHLLVSGAIDAALSTTDALEFRYLPGVMARPLSPHVLDQVRRTDRSTSLVVRADDYSVRALIRSVIDVDELMAFQGKVISGEVLPDY